MRNRSSTPARSGNPVIYNSSNPGLCRGNFLVLLPISLQLYKIVYTLPFDVDGPVIVGCPQVMDSPQLNIATHIYIAFVRVCVLGFLFYRQPT